MEQSGPDKADHERREARGDCGEWEEKFGGERSEDLD